jgi:hypothetical protein
MKWPFFISIIIAFIGISCKKHKPPQPDNPYGLPNATQTGANIFACRINGENFIAYNDINHLGASINYDTLIVGGEPKKRYIQTVFIQLTNLFEGSSYSIDNKTTIAKYITDSLCSGLVGNIYQFSALRGSVQLTKFDKANKVVSGKYDFVVPVTNCDTLRITDGRFDIRYG